jgi:hypothetical protein
LSSTRIDFIMIIHKCCLRKDHIYLQMHILSLKSGCPHCTYTLTFSQVRQGQLIVNGVVHKETYIATHSSYTMEAMVCCISSLSVSIVSCVKCILGHRTCHETLNTLVTVIVPAVFDRASLRCFLQTNKKH